LQSRQSILYITWVDLSRSNLSLPFFMRKKSKMFVRRRFERVAGLLNVGARGNISAKLRHSPFLPRFSNHHSLVDCKSLRNQRGEGLCSAAGASFIILIRKEAITRDAWRPPPVLSDRTPGALLNTECPAWTSATDGGRRHPFTAFEVALISSREREEPSAVPD